MKKRICDIVMETLVRRGIDQCFAVTGGGAMFLDNALFHCSDMKTVFNHHEQACAMAAEGYARFTGKPAVVCVTSGPGGTNTLTGVMGAWVDSIPMIVLSGQVRYTTSVAATGLDLRYRGTQEYNIVATVKPMTKYAVMVTDPRTVRRELNHAIDLAISGRKGPVWLDIPLDVQGTVVEEETLLPDLPSQPQPIVSPEDIAFVLARLKSAQRPVLLLGRGVICHGSRDIVVEVADTLKIPVLGSSSGADVCYREHPYFFGTTGTFGPRGGNFIIQNADLILSVGCSLGYSSTGFAPEAFAPKADIIAVDISLDEMRKPGLRLCRSIQSDAISFLSELAAKSKGVEGASSGWLEYCEKVTLRFSPFEGATNKKPGERVCAYVFWEHFYREAKDDSIVVLGNNTAIIGGLQCGIRSKSQRIINNKNCGSMGYDLPAAIGVAIAAKREVVLITGDGSFMMNLQELQTIIYHDLNIKIVLFENNGYNAIRQTAKNFFHGEEIGCTPASGVSFPSFKAIVNAFGIAYGYCDSNGEVDRALDWLQQQEGAALLEVKELLDDPIVPKLQSRMMRDGTLSAPILQDMAPFISEEEFQGLMMISEDE